MLCLVGNVSVSASGIGECVVGDFSDKVYNITSRIPRGKVASYGQIARLIGQPRKSRFVGFAMHSNPRPGTGPEDIPCHRVVFKDGALCEGYVFGGPNEQKKMLEAEGVIFVDDTHVDMEKCQWNGRDGIEEDGSLPVMPPADFDWKAELGEDL